MRFNICRAFVADGAPKVGSRRNRARGKAVSEAIAAPMLRTQATHSEPPGDEVGSDRIAGARVVRSGRAGQHGGDDMEAWVGIEPAYADLQSAA